MDKRKKHGLCGTPEYGVWNSMIMRCHWTPHISYKYYGARGISVCRRWRESFINFLADMGKRPHGMKLDRKNNDGNYEPGNCRWTDISTQNKNHRANKNISFYGTTLCIRDWERLLGFRVGILYARIAKGWDVRTALITPVAYRSPRKRC